MGRYERHPGWVFPTPDSGDWYEAQELAKMGVPCPVCGALVPPQYSQRHVDFHNSLPTKFNPGAAAPLQPVEIPPTPPREPRYPY